MSQMVDERVQIGHYVMGKTIGRGAFAKVKEAYHDLTGVRVAIKILNKRKMKNNHMISKVKREIKILKFINHPNIIKLYEVLDTTTELFVIMEMASQGELYEYIQNNEILEQEAKLLFRQIVSGVDYIHQNLIAHRDLKPENILIDSSKVIKIVDFGLSNLMKDGKLLKTACGSPNYAAPQIIGERKYEGTSVDIWSCGIILYVLLVGCFPFDEETLALLYRKIEQGLYTIPKSVSPLAADLIRRMLQVDATQRIKVYEIKTHPWLRSEVPIYCKVSSVFTTDKEQQFELDYEIFEKVRALFPADSNSNEEKVIKAIKKRDDLSFVITYELLKDEKYRLVGAAEGAKKSQTEDSASAIFKLLQNTLPPPKISKVPNFNYGKRYLTAPKILVEVLLRAFRNVGVEWEVKSTDFCLKCSYIPENFRQLQSSKSCSESEREQKTEKEMKFNKRLLTFTVQIYCCSMEKLEHMVDLHLSQGHPLVFINLAHRFFKMVDALILR